MNRRDFLKSILGASSSTILPTFQTLNKKDHYVGVWLCFPGFNRNSQKRRIVDYNPTTKVHTIDLSFTIQPTPADTFILKANHE